MPVSVHQCSSITLLHRSKMRRTRIVPGVSRHLNGGPNCALCDMTSLFSGSVCERRKVFGSHICTKICQTAATRPCLIFVCSQTSCSRKLFTYIILCKSGFLLQFLQKVNHSDFIKLVLIATLESIRSRSTTIRLASLLCRQSVVST